MFFVNWGIVVLKKRQRSAVPDAFAWDVLYLRSEGDLEATSLSEGGFGWLWAGSRANVGVAAGRYYFTCKLVCKQEVRSGVYILLG
eukprot:2939418-Pyramimonas_sp.AAC.1